MPRGNPIKTDGKMILAWREIRAGASREEVGRKYNVAPRTVGVWCTLVRKNKRLMEAATSGRRIAVNANNISNGKGSASLTIKTGPAMSALDKVEASIKGHSKFKELEEEIKFLRWWNEGERRGYVDRLLKQIQE